MRVKRKKKRRRWFLTWVRGEEEAKFEEIAATGCPTSWRGCPAWWSSQRLPSILIFSKVAQYHGYVAHHHDLAVSLLLRGCPASSSSTSFTSSHQPEAIRNKNSTSNKGNLQSWFLWRTKTTFVASAVFTQKSRFLVSGGEQVATTVALRGFIIPLGRIFGVGDFGRRMGQPSSGSTIHQWVNHPKVWDEPGIALFQVCTCSYANFMHNLSLPGGARTLPTNTSEPRMGFLQSRSSPLLNNWSIMVNAQYFNYQPSQWSPHYLSPTCWGSPRWYLCSPGTRPPHLWLAFSESWCFLI